MAYESPTYRIGERIGKIELRRPLAPEPSAWAGPDAA
jgi:hypothetical protein